MYGRYSGSLQGVVTSLEGNCGLLTSTDGHKFEFVADSKEIQKGSHVKFAVRFSPDWRNGIAKNVEIDPAPPKPPKFIITVQGCVNNEKL